MQQQKRLIAALAALAYAANAENEAHPIEKVVDLLKDLKQQVKEEVQAEEVTYSKFSRWCSNSLKTLSKAITESKEKVETLESTVASKTKEIEVLTEGIKKLEEEIAEYEAAGAAADEERKAAAELYETADKDLDTTISSIDEAIAALEGAKGSALLQTTLRKLSKLPLVLEQLSGSQLQALANGEEPMVMGDKEQHVKKYNFKSGNVIELLKELKTKFEDDKIAGTKEETNSQNSYTLAKQARDAATEAANTAKGEKEVLKGEAEQAKTDAEADLESTNADLQADETTESDTKKECDVKASEWKERSAIRENEQLAMDKAIEILAKVTGVRTEAPTNPVPPAPPAEAEDGTFLQAVDAYMAKVPKGAAGLVQMSSADSPSKQKAVTLLRSEARATHSKALARFAEQLSQRLGGPFDDINDMIQKMIFRLQAEQKDEDDHKNWCDLEMDKTNATIDQKTEKKESLLLKIEEGKAESAELMLQIKEANEMAAKLEAHIAEATEIRNIGKSENEKAIADAKSAQVALSQATAVLQQHYKDSGMVAKESYESFVQQPVELSDKPSTWDAGYTGVADPKAQPEGIITVLEKISADFAQMEADTKAQEEMDQKAYDEERKSCEVEKTRRNKEAEMKAANQKRVDDKVASDEKSLKSTKEALGAAEEYYKELGPPCMEGDATYEARKADREREISALKEAKVILQEAFNEKEGGAFLAPVRKAQ